MVTEEDGTKHNTKSDRLKQLIMFSTREETPTLEITESLKPSKNNDQFTFRKTFEQAYRMVKEVPQNYVPDTIMSSLGKFTLNYFPDHQCKRL